MIKFSSLGHKEERFHVISIFDLMVLGMPHARFLAPSFVATHLSHADGSRNLGIAGQHSGENLVF